jgi:hypothetical protein
MPAVQVARSVQRSSVPVSVIRDILVIRVIKTGDYRQLLSGLLGH